MDDLSVARDQRLQKKTDRAERVKIVVQISVDDQLCRRERSRFEIPPGISSTVIRGIGDGDGDGDVNVNVNVNVNGDGDERPLD